LENDKWRTSNVERAGSASSVFLALGFLIGTMMKSRHYGIQLWKSSTLAVLGALDRETRDELGDVRSVGDMLDRAKDITPAIRRWGYGWSVGINGQ
jgi:hypothetical protein